MKAFGRQYEISHRESGIDADEGVRSYREEWTCPNYICGEVWTNKPETWECAGEHDATMCPECLEKCLSCDRAFCGACLATVDWGDGPERTCPACLKDGNENLAKCDSCGAARVDVRAVAEDYEICGECRDTRNAA